MKYLALTTAAVALLAGPALAGTYETTHTTTTTTDVVLEVQDQKTIDLETFTSNPEQAYTFDLADNDNKIWVKGSTIKIMQPNGNTFFPPNGPYVTEEGLKFVADDGEVLRIEAPADLILVDADLNVDVQPAQGSNYKMNDDRRTQNRDANNYEVDVDADVDTRTMGGNYNG